MAINRTPSRPRAGGSFILSLVLGLVLATPAVAQVPLQSLVRHYLPHYLNYAGHAEAAGGPTLGTQHFVRWLANAGADDPVVINALSVRNARLEIASAFEFLFADLAAAGSTEGLGQLLRHTQAASQRYYMHVGQWPSQLDDLLSNPGQRYWQGPYLQPAGVQLVRQRFPAWRANISMATAADGAPPPPFATAANTPCRQVPWLVLQGLPPAQQTALKQWLDTAPAPQTGNVRLVDGVLFYRLD